MYRIWLAKLATLDEIDRWNICELADANEVLDVREDCEIISRERAER